MNVVNGRVMITAAEARAWAESMHLDEALRRVADEAPPIPDAAADLLRRLDFPASAEDARAAA